MPHTYMTSTCLKSHLLNPQLFVKYVFHSPIPFLHLAKLKFILDKGGLLMTPQEFSHNSATFPPTVDCKSFPWGTMAFSALHIQDLALNGPATAMQTQVSPINTCWMKVYSSFLKRPFISVVLSLTCCIPGLLQTCTSTVFSTFLYACATTPGLEYLNTCKRWYPTKRWWTLLYVYQFHVWK